MNTKRGNLLYVDDEEGNLLAFVATFRKFYDNIYTVTTAKEGIEILRKHPIDVVLTDQRMPDMTGVEFLEAINPEFPDTLRLIVTGFSDIDAVINAINSARVFRFIKKPWDKDELKRYIDQAINIRTLELSNRELVEILQKEVAKKEKTINVFQKYVPSDVVNEMMSPEQSAYASRIAELSVVTMLFCDIRGFNTPAEKTDPAEIIQFINDYFTIMAECIERHKGFINKLIGTGILVLFGAPTSYPDNTINAIYCALEMVLLLDKINENYKAKYGHAIEIGIGIGINTGESIAGNIGSPKHMEYTTIGDTLNTAIQVQDLTHDISKGVLITQSTYDEVKDHFECESLGPKKIRGKEETVNIYKVIKPLASK